MNMRASTDSSPTGRSRAHRSSRASGAQRTGRRSFSFPHLTTAGRRPSPTAVPAEPATPPTHDESHAVVRAWRMREVHVRSSKHACGLCLTAWPCRQRAWADRTLRDAHLGAAG